MVAVKQATPDLDQARRILAETDLVLYAGNDDLVAAVHVDRRGRAASAWDPTWPAAQFRQMIDLARAGDPDGARVIDQSLRPLYDALAVTTNPIPLKFALNLLGHEVGGLRLPLVEATPDEAAAVTPRARELRFAAGGDRLMAADPVRIIPLGGLGEVGKNMTVFEYRGRMVLLDTGLTFPRDDMLGIDIVLPDFTLRGRAGRQARRDRADPRARGSHRRAALPAARDRDVGRGVGYAADARPGQVEARRARPDAARRPGRDQARRRARFRSGPFTMEFMRVTHSVPDAVAVAFHTEFGPIIHTGDFKLDPTPIDNRPTDLARLRALGDEGVALLMSDSTNAEVPGSTRIGAHGRGIASRDHQQRARAG